MLWSNILFFRFTSVLKSSILKMQKAFQRITASFWGWKKTQGFNCFCASGSSDFCSINLEGTQHAASIYWQPLNIHFLKGCIRWQMNFKQSQFHFCIKTTPNSWTAYLLQNAWAAQAGWPSRQAIKQWIRCIAACKGGRVICCLLWILQWSKTGSQSSEGTFQCQELTHHGLILCHVLLSPPTPCTYHLCSSSWALLLCLYPCHQCTDKLTWYSALWKTSTEGMSQPRTNRFAQHSTQIMHFMCSNYNCTEQRGA